MNAKNSSFDYITMQFRLSKWGAMSIGLLPYSNIGYSMGSYVENEKVPENSYINTYSGEGGLHQLYLGAGFKILKNLSVGANISYLWGDISHSRYQTFPSNATVMPLTTVTGIEITSYKLDFGAQYTHQFGKKHAATLGVVFSPGHIERIARLFEVPVETLLDDYNLFLRNGQGDQIKAIRTKLGLTQRQYADKLGVSLCSLKQWEQNRKQIFKSTWERYFKQRLESCKKVR